MACCQWFTAVPTTSAPNRPVRFAKPDRSRPNILMMPKTNHAPTEAETAASPRRRRRRAAAGLPEQGLLHAAALRRPRGRRGPARRDPRRRLRRAPALGLRRRVLRDALQRDAGQLLLALPRHGRALRERGLVLRVRARERLLRDQPALHAQLRRRRAPPAHAPRRRGALRAAPHVRHGPRGRARAPRARRRDAGASRRPSPASRTLRETIERKPGASGTSRAPRLATGRARATSATTSCSPRGRTTTARASSTPGPCPAPTCRRCRPSCSSSRRTRARGGGRRRASSRPPSRTRSPGRCGGLRVARRRRGGGCRSNSDARGRTYGR